MTTERTASTLRRLFDDGFALPPAPAPGAAADLILVRIGADSFALRLSRIASLHANLKIIAIPGAEAPSLGLTGLRGSLVPVYDLAHLLGYPSAVNPRWQALVQTPYPVAFAFETLESHCRVDEAALMDSAHAGSTPTGRHTGGVVRAAGGLHPLIQIDSLLTHIRERS